MLTPLTWHSTGAKEKPVVANGLPEIKAWRCPTLTWGGPTLPSALLRFTTEFGMGSGGSIMLWSPSKILTILKTV